MPANNITINRSAIGSGEAVSAALVTREALTKLEAHVAKMNEMVDGTNYNVIETYYGVPAGGGEAYRTLVIGARDAVKSLATNQYINRVT